MRRRQRGMAAQEKQRQRVVLVGMPLPGALGIGGRLQRGLGHPIGRPLQRRREQRLLHGVLASVELAVLAHQRTQDLRGELPQQVCDPVFRVQCAAGRFRVPRPGHDPATRA